MTFWTIYSYRTTHTGMTAQIKTNLGFGWKSKFPRA
jgi:hypothetical protein